MAFKHTVPLRTQAASMECWYVSAMMVAQFRVAGPRLGLPDKWIKNNGITAQDFSRLAQVEGFQSVPVPAGKFESQTLEQVLRLYGPLWCAGRWDGVPHIVVLTGVDGDLVFINDPNPARGVRTESLAWFNQRLEHIPNALLYMPR